MVSLKHKRDKKAKDSNPQPEPKLARRSEHRKSTLYSGRTIGEQREQLETASERIAIHEKAKRKKTRRIIFTIIVFLLLAASLVYLIITFINVHQGESGSGSDSGVVVFSYKPTIEIIDEDASATGGHLTSRMKEYIGQAEFDFRELGYVPIKAVIPTGAIREVDFYLDGYTGFIKMIIDRGTGVSTEDADRMIRYLESIGVADFEYIDVRIDGKAYWK